MDPECPDAAVLDEAGAVLRAGGLVAFATETVYGLGADATNAAAVAGIYEAKGRPAFNPLIVHADSLVMALSCVSHWPEIAAKLAASFWPGPLTLVLPKSSLIPDIVTAGRPTVGVRIPRPRVTRELIAKTGRPLAAPSANLSTGVSPTLASHVLDDLGGRIDLILDSGQTTLGLESTVLDLSTGSPRSLRPGPISASAIEEVVGELHLQDDQHTISDRPSSPGQLAVHYSPKTAAVRIDELSELASTPNMGTTAYVILGKHNLTEIAGAPHQYLLENPELAAREFYRVLRACDALGVRRIVVISPPDQPEWRAVRDRLWRATQPVAGLRDPRP